MCTKMIVDTNVRVNVNDAVLKWVDKWICLGSKMKSDEKFD